MKKQIVDHCNSIRQAIKKGYLFYEPKELYGSHKQTEYTVLIRDVFDITVLK